MSLTKKAGKASILLLLRRVWGGIVSFIVMAYLARELDVKDFGVLAISSVFIDLSRSLIVSGISEFALFQKDANQKDLFNAVFWFSALACLLLCIIVIPIAPFWASYYDNDKIQGIIYLLLVSSVLQIMGEVPSAIFKKEINFAPLIKTQMIMNTIANVGKVVFAYLGFGVYSLALPSAIVAPITTFLLFYQAHFIPRRVLGLEYWKRIFNFTRYVVGQRILGALVYKGDQFILGSIWGMELLGVYSLASQFAQLIPTYLTPVVQSVTDPILAKENDDLDKLKEYFHKVIRMISFIIIPMLFLILINTEFLITSIYGQKWEAAVIPAQFIMLHLLVRTVSSPTSGLYTIVNKPKIGYYYNLIYSPVFLALLFVLASNLEFTIAILAICMVKILGSMAHFFIIPHYSHESRTSILKVVSPIYFSSLIALLFVIPIFYYEGLLFMILKSLIFIGVLIGSMRLLNKKNTELFLKSIKPLIPTKFQRFI